MGVAAYNAECRKIVMRYSQQWEVWLPTAASSGVTAWSSPRISSPVLVAGLTSRMTTRLCTLGSWRASGR